MKQYYLFNGSVNEGPFTVDELRERGITRNTLVFSTPGNDWKKAGKYPELLSLLPPDVYRVSFPFTMRGALILLAVIITILLSVLGYALWKHNRVSVLQDAKIQTEKDALAYTKAFTREHIHELVYLTNSSYSVNFFGGISGLRVSVTNSSELMMDLVSAEVLYIKDNGETYKTETLHFNNVKPNTTQTQHAPESDRGTSVSCRISLVRSVAAGL